MRIACIQLNPQNDVQGNLSVAQKLIREAASQDAKIIVLPEMFAFMGTDAERLRIADEAGAGVFSEIAKLAKELSVHIIGGSHAQVSKNQERVFNTCEVYSPEGSLLNRYQKIHLFNLYATNGEKLFCESDAFLAGNATAPFSITSEGETWNSLVGICYDLRFPEFFRPEEAKAKPLDIIFLPAAFTHQTGKDHWEVLVRARAIENQCFVVACNQTGTFLKGTKRNYGHSMVVSPWGEIVASFNEDVGILYAELNKTGIGQARTKLPAVFNRML
jgi:predicted amidohydrolase